MSKDASDYNIADILRNVNNPAADHSNIQGTIVAYNITAMCIVVITVAVRTLVRSLIVRHVATEDYLMLGAGMAAVSLSAMVIVGQSLTHVPQKYLTRGQVLVMVLGRTSGI